MAMHTHTNDTDEELLSTINTTPLVDVMMVLLIIFLITIPAASDSFNIDLPNATQALNTIRPEHIFVTITGEGHIHLFEKRIANEIEFLQTIKHLTEQSEQPTVQLFAETTTKYQTISHVLRLLKTAGLSKINFVTEPE